MVAVGIDSVLSLPSLLALYVDNHRARTFPFEPSCAPTHAAVSAMGPLRCCCGQRDCAELVTAKARATWAEEQGAKWDWHSDRQAYWYLCPPCHKKFWNDGQSKSPWSQPGQRLSLGGLTPPTKTIYPLHTSPTPSTHTP